MLSRTEKAIIGMIESKHSELSPGELETMVQREEISDIKITFIYSKDSNGNLNGKIQAVYDIGIKQKKQS